MTFKRIMLCFMKITKCQSLHITTTTIAFFLKKIKPKRIFSYKP